MIRRDRISARAVGRTIGVLLLCLAAWSLPAERASAQAVPGTCPAALGSADIIDHDFSVSFCELCNVGTVRILVENPFRSRDDVDFSDIVVTEDLRASGLTYVAGTTTFSGRNIAVPPVVEPTVSGPDGSILTWTLSSAFTLDGRLGGAGSLETLIIEFDVERHMDVGDEGLVQADRTIEAAVEFEPSCAPGERFSTSSDLGVLPLREPIPQIIKLGRNLDAGQDAGSYSAPVYGHEFDDVIWQIQVRNTGLADLQDFVFSDSIVPGNFSIHHVCDNEADATAAANGASPPDCVSVGGVTDVFDLDVAQAFGGGANPYIVARAGGSGFYYLVGEITDSCTNRTNTVYDVEWGCQAEPPVGGISATSDGVTAGDSALLSTLSLESGVDIDVALRGFNTRQPMGGKGTVIVTIRNRSGGTIKHQNGIRLRELLPAEYVVDTSVPADLDLDVVPAYGNAYPGMVDTLDWTNPVAGTFPLVTANPADPLGNTDLEFLLTSSTVHPDFADQRNMIRHGDVVTLTIPVVQIDSQYYDRVANVDVRTEEPGSDPPGTDPIEDFPASSLLEIWYEEFCTDTEHNLIFDDDDTARPEDLDVDIVGSELVFILTNTGDPLALSVALTNRGGHDARDYQAYVTFGEAMVVQTAPAGCSATTNPPALPIWQLPAALPATASVYVCDRGVIRPGERELLNFQVVKNTADSFDDDLTFRADVIGEITLRDGTPLWFPAPIARADSITDRGNNYSIDALRAKVVGYNLKKDQLGICSENNPPPNDPDTEVQIGEECTFHVESGGWFGFQTPGFTYIAVQNVQVVDQIPDGQGYIASTDPLGQSTTAIQGVRLNPPPDPLDEGFFDWTFNTLVPAERITEKDHWFRVDVSTRLLNDPIDTRAPPNQHAAISTNILTSTFEAIFLNPLTEQEELYNLGPNTIGFPREAHRRVDLTVTEPLLTVTKEVCNETRYGAGPACTNFVDLADDGDAFDTYVYRVTVSNEAESGGATRAPAYDVTVTSVTDPSDELFVAPLTGDGLDNDADALIDAGDAAGEGQITDNSVLNGIPAEVVASYTHSDALRRIDASESVTLYYRVDPNDEVAPLQRLTSTVSAAYDSLEDASGAQTPPQGANGEIGGARQYVSDPAEATIQILAVEVRPKQIVRISNSALAAPPAPQPVSIGEEIEFQLRTLIPVAQLRNFVIRDQLPLGLSCSHAPAVDLDAPPYDAAGFVPGGTTTPTCTDTEVVWDFGNQIVTQSDRVDRRFDFAIQFIARLDNIAANQDGVDIRNGGNATVTTVAYIDEAGTPVVLEIGEAAMVVREPAIALTKTFSVAEVDAGDLPRVSVTATNTGTSTAYNLRVLDDLSAVDLSYAGDITGAAPPTAELATFGPDAPLFTWDPGFGIDPGETVTFSFAVEVDVEAEPLENLENTIQADWTSLPGRDTAMNPSGEIGPDGSPTGMRNGALPNAGDPLNDYETEGSASVDVPAVVLDKVDLDPALAPEIGVHKPFQVVIELPEGTTNGLLVTDALDSGSVSYVLADNADFAISYEFVGIATINDRQPDSDSFIAVPVDGTSGSAVWSIGTVVTDTEDDLATQLVTPTIQITYFARVNNDLDTDVGSTLQNGITVDYIEGETGGPAAETDATAAIVAIESSLTATKALTNVTPGKAPGDPPAFDDILQYVITVVNGGNATAYDVNVVDTLPPELALYGGFAPTASIDATPVVGFVSTPTGSPNGPLVWGRQNGDDTLDILQGGFLELTYQVIVRTPILDEVVLANSAWIDWTSLESDSIYERTGDGCPTITPPDDYCFGPAVAEGTAEPIAPPDPLLKEITQATAAVGEAFRYRITIPETPYAFPIYDVRILDDLTTSAADLRLLGGSKLSGSEPWSPVNNGTATNLVIEDSTIGIDIPAGEQIVVEITVVLEDTPANVTGLSFTNTGRFLYNWIDGNDASERPGDSGTSEPMTIVGPDVVTLEKSGPAQISIGAPETFALDIHNASDGPAWNLTLTDLLPTGATGGTCDAAPSQITAQVFEANGTTPVSALLVEGSDFSVDFMDEPDCRLTLSMLTAAAAIDADQRLIVTYEALLDTDSQDGEVLTNVAGATGWFSADPSDPDTVDDRRTFTRVLTDGTVGVLDHEDAHSTTVALPEYLFEKAVVNVTTGADPATTATPGDRLRYQLRIENLTDAQLDNLSISDELDRLNDPAAFAPGTLTLVTVPAGADTSNTNSTGGAKGTGVLDVRDLSLPGLNDSVLVEFEVTLAPVIADGTLVTNQSQLLTNDVPFAVSDDPNVNGSADPLVAGDEDPTQVMIESAPDFQVEKISSYVTGDPSVLLAGETLRYTITVKNVGTDDAVDTVLRDDVPVNTTYVSGSTTLNGVPVADAPGGRSPLSAGIQLNAPEDPTPGAMRADASATSSNVATVVFDVVVDSGVVDGTVISNQTFVSAPAGGVSDQPSDDPRTPTLDDPTRDVVGNSPLLFAAKDAVIGVDAGTLGIVDPGDVLHYTISVHNSGAVAATAAALQDTVPANTAYVPNSVTLNGLPVGQPDGGVFPLVLGIPISSSDLTPPLPGSGEGTINPGQTALIEFDLQVDSGAPGGTLISNQAVVSSSEVPSLLTDGDGNPATGPEPTVVVVGAGQQLSIAKQVAVVGGGAALAGSELQYVVRVTNVAAVPASNVVITDDLDVPAPGQLTYVAGSATLNGSSVGVSVVGSVITADYSGSYGPVDPGEVVVLRFRATIDATLPLGTTVTNVAEVSWNDPSQTLSASVAVDVGGMPGVGVLNGTLWHDADFDRTLDLAERALSGWTIELSRNGQPVQSVVSDASGAYSIGGLPPNDVTGDAYALRFRAPGAGSSTAALGTADSPFTNGLQEITDILVPSGANFQGLNLPIDPNGVVYGALPRTPVAGATLTLLGASDQAPLPATCFDDPAQQGQVTGGDGYYKFSLNFSDAACQSAGDYLIAVAPPGSGYDTGTSQLIPPTSDASTAPLSVPTCPGDANDAVPATAQYCEAQVSEFAPPASVPAGSAGTRYHIHLTLDASQMPGSSQLFNNHIPLDPVLGADVNLSKTTPKVSVSRGDLVPYEIALHNQLPAEIIGLRIRDRFPTGFRYVEGSARIDGVPTEPAIAGQELVWNDLVVGAASSRKLALLLAVGAGVSEGEYTNRAQAFDGETDTALTLEAQATVRVVPDPTFDCTDVLGKVFDDANRNGSQDEGERGLPGVRLVTVRGLVATTDQHGRYHITCAVVPREDRGSNFILKLDDRTLPTGYRMTTRQVQVQRATRGKALRLNFGAAIHRVVGLDLADAVFEPGTEQMRGQWKPRIDLLLEELDKTPSILRLSYVADVEAPGLVERRLDAIKALIAEAWKARDGYPLTIEIEVFWRRGAPQESPAAGLFDSNALDTLPPVGAGPPFVEAARGESVERHLPIDAPFTTWSQDPAFLETRRGDKLEEREVLAERPETVKLANVVPPIRFESGVADIPVSTIERLRGILDSMQHLRDVRLHLVGHADDQPLSESLSEIYGDNEGLSRERAGEVAEFLQAALALPPESISFAWAGASQPIASNDTPEGRALNRRVEVEVWHDVIREELTLEEVVVPDEIKRVKVCRTETVCKLRYREGNARRARVRNLIAPLQFSEEAVDVPAEFIRQVGEALDNLRHKQNVTLKFIGFTDDMPLTGRTERIYGTHLALSKARSRRVALAVQDGLDLPTAAIESDGRGATRPIASNATTRGRALNRRVEVEFWHDDPLQELPDDPQPCPDAAEAERVTKVYDPPWGRIAPLAVEDGEIQIPEGYADALRRAMADVAHEAHVRLRFVGYTRNERLDRRTALVYGDDIGLSTARARRAMQQIRTAFDLSDEQAEHEGRGYVHSNDVVNGGFLQGESDHVVVQVIYDELALLDDYEGVEVTPITREIEPKDPLALNLMRISVDGEPIDDPGRSLEDIQRCTDVALERADIHFRFDNLASASRLSVTSEPTSVPVAPSFEAGSGASLVRFRMYTNYAAFIDRSEVRIFDRDASLQSDPLAVAAVDREGFAQWRPDPGSFPAPVRELKYVLRAYDAEGRFDETAPQVLWMIYADPIDDAPEALDSAHQNELLAGYGESGPLSRNIPLDNVGTVTIHGSDVPPGHSVWVAGAPVPVDEDGNFVAEAVLPAGMHTVEVAMLDEAGNGELFLRDLEFEKSDWFYMGIADLTVSGSKTSGPADLLEGEDAPIDRDSHVDGRLAFYVNGKFAEDWKLTASADTREEPLEDLFSNFLDKSPGALLRRIDPDYYYPTFGDDSSVEETAPTLGKFYLKLSKDETHALWGNFKVSYLDNELAHVDRGLYGANLHYQTLETTRFGEQRLVLDGFAADPGTVPGRDEFRGTGGSLYFLRRQDLLIGSERVRIEVRDKDSGLVTGVVHLRYGLDYDIDYFQGRIVLSEPLPSTVDDDLLVRSGGLSGNEAWLSVQYEFTPGLDEIDTLAAGGNGQFWLNGFVKLGVTANQNEEENVDSSLYAADLTLRASTRSWLKVQAGRSEGLVATSLRSGDGGFNFTGTGSPGIEESDDAHAYRADLSIGFADLLDGARGQLSVYAQRLEQGYSAPGQTALTDTDYLGGSLELPLTRWLRIGAKADWLIRDAGLETQTQEVDVAYQLSDGWGLSAGVRNDLRKDDSPLAPQTQEVGERTDTVLQLGYDSSDSWRAYLFGQATVRSTGNREENNRVGVGGAYRISDWLSFDAEVSQGDLGLAAQVGTSYQQSERTNLYLTYALENERALNGMHARMGNLVAGARTRLSDSGSVFVENRYQHASTTGLTRAVGVDLAPTDRLSLGANWESGELKNRLTYAETQRQAGGVRLGYRFDKVLFSSGVEYRFDETEQPDGSWTDRRTWLFRNNLRLQLTPDWRLLGKFNHAISDSSLGAFFDGGYTEGVLGYAYRPVDHDRLNALAKYTYFYNVPTTDQLSVLGTPAQFIQKSHIASVDVTYDLFANFSVGGKYAYRLGQVSLDREDPDFFDNSAHLYILRGDLRFLKNWETSAEGRMLHLPALDERRSGALVTLYRYLGDHFKVGVGYSFTDFSDDLTDLSYDHQGWFFNIVGTL